MLPIDYFSFILALLLGILQTGELTSTAEAAKDPLTFDPLCVNPLTLDPVPGPIDVACMQKNCMATYTACFSETSCQKLITCFNKCYEAFNTDSSPMKSDTQACIFTCTYSYGDTVYTDYVQCLTDNQCFDLPSVATPCRYPKLVNTTKNYTTSDLKGDWWVARGYNHAYDCYSCQHIFFDAAVQSKDCKYLYRPTFEVLAVNGTRTLINGTITVQLGDTGPGEAINLDYTVYGAPVNLTWHVLDGSTDNSTLLVYYCGSILTQWSFEGALVLTRSPKLPPEADEQFAEMVAKNTNLEYGKFCSPQLNPCSN